MKAYKAYLGKYHGAYSFWIAFILWEDGGKQLTFIIWLHPTIDLFTPSFCENDNYFNLKFWFMS